MAGTTRIPEKMKHLKQSNGYPVPFIAFDAGKPQFTINDDRKVMQALLGGLCAICGNVLDGDVHLVGGPRSALDPRGMYRDPPAHYECIKYALQVCPYLAVPSYAGQKAEAREKRVAEALDNNAIVKDHTMIPGKPDTFYVIRVNGFRVFDKDGSALIIPNRPFTYAEEWRDGQCLACYTPAVCRTTLRYKGLELLHGDGLTLRDLPSVVRKSWDGKYEGRHAAVVKL